MDVTQVADSGILSILLALKDQPGWQLYIERLNDAVVEDLNKLRGYPAADIRFLQGEIAGLEAAAGAVDAMITEIRAAGERQRQKEQAEINRMYREQSETQFG